MFYERTYTFGSDQPDRSSSGQEKYEVKKIHFENILRQDLDFTKSFRIFVRGMKNNSRIILCEKFFKPM